MRSAMLAVALAATSSFAVAQTFIVDAANGPGTNFTDLPTAVGAVPSGAILLVRPGAYGPAQLNGKGMSILATAPGVTIDGLFTVPVRVLNLGANQSFTLRGVALGEAGGIGGDRVQLQSCAGPVLVEAVTFISSQPNLGAVLFPIAVHADGCAQVTVRDCTLRAFFCVQSRNSAVAIEGCTMVGNPALNLPHVGAAAGRAVHVEGGTVSLARCRVVGGDGFSQFNLRADPGAAVEIHGGEVRLYEDPASSYLAGQLSGGAPTPAIGGTAGTVIRTPEAALAGSNGGPPVAAVLVDRIRPLPSLRTVPAPPGGTVAADVATPVGELVLLAVALPGAPAGVFGVDGRFWLDGATATLVAVGVPQPGVPVTHSVAVPNNAALLAARFAWQAVAWSAAGGLRASNPSTYAH